MTGSGSHKFFRSRRFDCLLLLIFASVLFFWRLGSTSLGSRDESIYTLATQSILLTGDWWSPTLNGRPFTMKPPMRLWTGAAILKLLGQSNFTFRLPDALCGLLIVILTYLIGMQLHSRRLAAFLGALSLICCKWFVLLHGPRQATTDCMLTMFFTLAVYCGIRLINTLEQPAPAPRSASAESWRWAIFGGLAVGLGAFTRSVAIYPVLGIFALNALLSGRLQELIRGRWKQLLTVLTIGLAVPFPYYLWHSLYTKGGFATLVKYEITRRVTSGYVNQDDTWMYFERIFIDGNAFPIFVLLLAVINSLRMIITERNRTHLLLFVWAAVPLVLYSLARSKLPSYVAAIYPAFGLMIGLFLADLIRELSSSIRKAIGIKARLHSAALLLVLGICFVELSLYCTSIATTIAETDRVIPLDKIVRNIKTHEAAGHPAQILSLANNEKPTASDIYQGIEVQYREEMRSLDVAFQEMVYRNLLLPYLHPVSSYAEMVEKIRNGASDFAIINAGDLSEITGAKPILRYLDLLPVAQRRHELLFLSYVDSSNLKYLSPTRVLVEPKDPLFTIIYGFGRYGKFGTDFGRSATGSQSAFTLEGDPLRSALSSKMSIEISPAEPMELEIFLNQKLVNKIVPMLHGKGTYQFDIPPKVWRDDRNIVTLVSHLKNGDEIGNWQMSFVLGNMTFALNDVTQ